MTKMVLISGVFLVSATSVASAGGINLSWTDCGIAGQTHRYFACNSDTGSHVLVASFDPPADLPNVTGYSLIYDLQSASDPLPAWWDLFNPGSCRSGPTLNARFATANCTDLFEGLNAGGIVAYMSTGSNKRRLVGVWSRNTAESIPAAAGTEYYAVNVVISNAKTLGGACPGCPDPVCIVLNEILISQPAGVPGESPAVTNPLDANHVTWQGGAVGGDGCPGATPTVNTTWGRVKSIYR